MSGVKYVLLIDVGLSHCPNDYKPSTLKECPLISEVSHRYIKDADYVILGVIFVYLSGQAISNDGMGRTN